MKLKDLYINCQNITDETVFIVNRIDENVCKYLSTITGSYWDRNITMDMRESEVYTFKFDDDFSTIEVTIM